MNLPTRLDELAKIQPDKPALIYFNEADWTTVTYKELADLSNRLFSGLSACSLTPGMRAALMTPPSIEFFALAFALLKFGIIPIIVDPAIGLKKVAECLAESKPDIFFGNTLTHTLRILFSWGKDSIKHNLTINKVESQRSKVENPNFQFTNLPIYQLPISTPAAIIFTSGSTGTPKGVLYTRENFTAQLELLQNTFNISPDEIDLPAFPLYALIDVLLGVTSVIPDINFPVPGKTDPEKVLRAIKKFKVTNMFASPVVLEILSSFAESDHASSHPILLSSLKRIITAGAPATIDLQRRFRHLLADHTDLFGIYGATETLPIAKVESREIFSLEEKTKHGAGICLGKPIEGVTVRIIPITDEPILEWQDSLTVESNVVGEITVQSAATTRTYIHRPDANRISKIGHRNDIIHRTGDVGYFDDDGRLWYCGRKSHRVVTDDGVLFTEQIENIFNAHPQVNRTALVGVERKPVLWVELKRGAKNKDTIKCELTELAAFHPQVSKIQTFLFMKKFPTDVRHNSKIIREQLTTLAKSQITNH